MMSNQEGVEWVELAHEMLRQAKEEKLLDDDLIRYFELELSNETLAVFSLPEEDKFYFFVKEIVQEFFEGDLGPFELIAQSLISNMYKNKKNKKSWFASSLQVFFGFSSGEEKKDPLPFERLLIGTYSLIKEAKGNLLEKEALSKRWQELLCVNGFSKETAVNICSNYIVQLEFLLRSGLLL